MTTPWAYHELDPTGRYHQRSRPVACDCGAAARESECADVGGHWVFCPACGVVDAGGPDRATWATGPVDAEALHPLWG